MLNCSAEEGVCIYDRVIYIDLSGICSLLVIPVPYPLFELYCPTSCVPMRQENSLNPNWKDSKR